MKIIERNGKVVDTMIEQYTEKGVKVFNVEWNDPNYHNEEFEVTGYDMDDEIDIENLLDQQETDCNDEETRSDLKIIGYEYEIYVE